MEEYNAFKDAFYVIITLVMIGQFLLNFWAWKIQHRIASSVENEPVPVAFKDREEVTFWHTVSSGLLTIIGLNTVFRVLVDSQLILVVFGIALTVKAMPSLRWLTKYYRGGFNE